MLQTTSKSLDFHLNLDRTPCSLVSALFSPWGVCSEVGKSTKLIQNWTETNISRNFSLNTNLAQAYSGDVNEIASTLNLPYPFECCSCSISRYDEVN